MTDRKFTPPTTFPAEYVNRDGRKAVILGETPDKDHPYVGWYDHRAGIAVNSIWTKDGAFYMADPSDCDLHDTPKKQVHWANDYGDFPGHWNDSRENADAHTGPADRIAVIRREWVDGLSPQYFMEQL
jgi:hypothetical protein